MALNLSVIFDGKNQKLKQATNQSVSDIKRLGDTAKRVTGVIGSAYAAATSARALLDNQKMVDRWGAQMRVAAGGTEEARVKMGELNQMADETGTRIDELVLGFTRLSNLGLQPSEDALLSYMNTSQAMGKSLEQFIEAVADASVAEFERLKEFGIKARNEGETIKFTFQGITTEVANSANAIQDYLIGIGENQFAGIVDEQADQVEAALNRMENQWIKTLQAINEGGLGDAMKATIETGTEALAGFTTFIQEEGDTIIDVGKAIAAVFLARVLGATAAATRGFMLHQVAQVRVIARYAAMNSMSSMAAARLVAVGTAARFASAGMAMLGGPVGVIALASYALWEYNRAGNAASAQTLEQADSIAELRKQIKGLAEDQEDQIRAEIQSAKAKAQLRRDEVSALMEAQQRIIDQTNPTGRGASTRINNAREQLKRLRIELLQADRNYADAVRAGQEYEETLKKIAKQSREAAEQAAGAGEAVADSADSFEKLTDKLAMQMVELALSEEQWERYQILQEAGTNLSEEQIATLDRLIARIRELRQAKEDELETERRRQEFESSLGSLTNSLTPANAEINRLAQNIMALEAAKQDPSLMPSVYTYDENVEGGFRMETEAEKLARINAMKELEMQRHTEAMAQINGDMTAQIDAMWSETFDRFAAGIGDAVADSLLEGDSFAETMQSLYKNVAKTIISSLIEIGVKRMLLAATEQKAAAATSSANIAAIGATTAASTAATATTTATQTAAAATVATAWTPAAIWASIGSFGQAAIIAGGAILAVKALGGFRKGGYTGDYGVNDVAGVVHGREFVFDAKSTSAIGVENLERMMSSAHQGAILGIAHNGISRVPASHEGTWMLRKDEMVLNPEQRENFEFLVDHLKAQRPSNVAAATGGGNGGGGVKLEFYQEFKFEGGAGGNREEVEQAVIAANERFKAELIDDFSSGGRIYQTLRAKGG